MNDIDRIKNLLRKFADERDWDQFHSPKNLSMALCKETTEIIEHFQWLTQDQSFNLSKKKHQKIEEEIADSFIYLIRLADKLDIDIAEVAYQKIEKNRKKYPIDKSKGTAKKYTELDQ
ncbi:MAG: nucleotide pyrophosphohydrolase [Thermodesulfobacteriota bacterium]